MPVSILVLIVEHLSLRQEVEYQLQGEEYQLQEEGFEQPKEGEERKELPLEEGHWRNEGDLLIPCVMFLFWVQGEVQQQECVFPLLEEEPRCLESQRMQENQQKEKDVDRLR